MLILTVVLSTCQYLLYLKSHRAFLDTRARHHWQVLVPFFCQERFFKNAKRPITTIYSLIHLGVSYLGVPVSLTHCDRFRRDGAHCDATSQVRDSSRRRTI